MSDILFIAHRIPYPPDRGDKIRSWHILKELSRNADVHVAALVDDPRDWRYQPMLDTVAKSVVLEPRNLSKARAAAAGLLTGQSASVRAFSNSKLRDRINAILARQSISTIFVYSGQMAQYVPENRGSVRFIMDFVDMDSAKFASYADQATGPASWAMRMEAERLFAFEKRTAARADHSVFVSPAEAGLFRKATGFNEHRVSSLENGIDHTHFDPVQEFPAIAQKDGPFIVFTGQMDYRPNIDAVIAFATQTLPLIHNARPDAQFAIVGRAPTPEVRDLAHLPGVIVTGEVEDTRDWLAAADMVVAPLKIARGVQNKVLEAMAMARPVIASSHAAEGIDATPGRELIVAESAEEEAQAALKLITEPAFALGIGERARKRMLARYSWPSQLAGLSQLIHARVRT